LARAVGHADPAAFSADLCARFAALGVADLFRRHVPDMNAAMELAPQMITPGRADNNLRAVSAEDVAELLVASLAQVDSNYLAHASRPVAPASCRRPFLVRVRSRNPEYAYRLPRLEPVPGRPLRRNRTAL